ncbi:MAG: bifunctional DNA-formamidopyrimidine glycosylase/DNA-(apurinic or apyrimidinic site) lyase [Desulfohalobiaceae bacterium]
MPELPEVETIARGLQKPLCGQRIVAWDILNPGSAKGFAGPALSQLSNEQITGVSRRGKLLFLELGQELLLAFHLRMTGRLLLEAATNPEKHTRLIISLSSGQDLIFQDKRKFGYCRLLARCDLDSWPFFASLGPEPLQIGRQEFQALFSGKRARIKSLLLDQRFIAGIGNIYADEALYLAGIHPACAACDLQQPQFGALHQALQEVLLRAINCGGSSFSDYVNSLGQAGSYQDGFLVYGRKGQSCKKCGSMLQGAKVAGRGTVFCPCCQFF